MTGRTDASLRAALQQASALLRQGQHQAAASLLEKSLVLSPDQPDLLHLLASARAMAGNLRDAEALYRRSLALNPHQAHVALNLGHVLKKQGHHGPAIDAYQTAVRLKPDDPESHHALGVALHNQRSFSEAERAYRNALRLDPSRLSAKVGLAGTLIDMKRPQEAVALLSEARSETSQPALLAAIEHHLGLANVAGGAHAEALGHFESAEHAHPGHSSGGGRARALQSLGRDEEAVASLQRAVAAEPLNLTAHYELNQLLYRLGRDGEFLRSYDEAAAKVPGASAIPMAKAGFLARSGKPAEALELYEAALRLDPSNREAAQGRAAALVKLGQFRDAISLYENALSRAPDDAGTLINLAMAGLSAAEPQLAVRAAEQALSVRAHDQMALATLGLAWRMLGNGREHELNDYDGLVQVFDLEPPESHSSMASFNAELNAYLDALHPRAREYLDQSLRGGTQTPDILNAQHPLVAGLRRRIDQAVLAYIQRQKANAAHPFLSRLTADIVTAGSWSSRLHDHGYHANHVHPAGWISSAYYVALPEVMNQSPSRQGWLKFGEPPAEMRLPDDARFFAEPKPGRLILFPSYMWHGTVPFASSQSRTTVAFDVIPAR